jgi:hypothetical protein
MVWMELTTVDGSRQTVEMLAEQAVQLAEMLTGEAQTAYDCPDVAALRVAWREGRA